ncbi:hypothetical protein J8273_0720 [Carpediemonas membranifera]|uniref:Cell division cycle protein 123 n=1 Tax=Carpediemonas membranifera TaxID=201153 RepID=A0A8J6B3J9_9EUKA|nr:hypothetical protein J8273_0720 [Carpediemonas membranifera]|eukprot:KAG9397590.1 hypothetical protein J8273_0720 [Carpediemonas membranifera]
MSEDIRLCAIDKWYPLFSTPKQYSFETLITSLPSDFLSKDGIFAPSEEDLDKEPYPDIQDAIDEWGTVFPKTSWSAPLDADFMVARSGLRCTTPTDVALVLQASNRISHDVHHAYDGTELEGETYPVTLALRQWKHIAPAGEVRVFLRRAGNCEWKVAGVCQRSAAYAEEWGNATNRAVIQDVSAKFAEDIIAPRLDKLGLARAAVDIYLPHIRSTTAPRVIDINPWSGPTDPLLFTWEELEELEGAEVRSVREGETRLMDPEREAQFPLEISAGLSGDVSVEQLVKLMQQGGK